MKKLNKIFCMLITVLQILLLAGIYMVNYFTHKKMGMLRYVIYKNSTWENIYPIKQIQYFIIALFIILAILVICLKRKSQSNKNILSSNIFMIVLVVIYSVFNLLYSTEDFRAFYFMSAILAVTTLLQIVKVFMSVLLCKNNKQ